MLEAIGIALMVLLLRATDVSLATLKTIFIIEGRSGLAPTLGFFEATIYVIAATLVFRDLGNPYTIVGFGAGFAFGTALGMFIAGKLGLGSVTLRLIKTGEADELIDALRGASFRLTALSGTGRDGPVTLIQMNLRKRRVPSALDVAKPWLSECFATVGDEPLDAADGPAVIEVLQKMPVVSWALAARKVHP
jgi:uncharacterized protein YebE (UPF0316 family)